MNEIQSGFCSECGASQPRTARFCSECGKSLSWAEVETVPPEPAPVIPPPSIPPTINNSTPIVPPEPSTATKSQTQALPKIYLGCLGLIVLFTIIGNMLPNSSQTDANGGQATIAQPTPKPTETAQQKKQRLIEERKHREAEQKRRRAAEIKAEAQAKVAKEAEATREARKAERVVNEVNEFMSAVRDHDPEGLLIESASARGNQLTITVTSTWHEQNYQTRLQLAQLLWNLWSGIHSPNNLDDSRIKIVDYNGNRVGGSGVIAGSMVGVSD